MMSLCISFPVAAAQETIRLGIYHNPPLSFVEGNREPSGFVPDLLKYISDQEDWRIEYVTCDWDECNSLLSFGEIHMLSPVSVSEGRARRYDFNRESFFVNWGADRDGWKG
ncbi:transporter substrate-binding domain-containing protein [Solemya velesiana gill symbiont]|nr:transporter substrate-binding domain-containing protein [Solemya velesiana gill symbiont]